ncbi:hypothetical protein [Saccharothrix coeruleofusca]|uniref:Uncharacterized protein n=1 Tax=Saccharothrix coeruleofusca TaxID=33919 RepID=A0A918ARF9_9PSEU|nr:hypothetical protein [Saccharothrix coeruleofusca]GGP74021.1 hypothetical protein GCM10010185_54430 [Saccharothrix coeruleofusca]
MLPQLAQGPGNTFWVTPSEVTSALQGVSRAFTDALPGVPAAEPAATSDDAARAADDANRAAEAAAEAVADAETARRVSTPA